MRAEGGGELRGLGAEQMVLHDVPRPVEPESRQLREHAALVGDARAEHVIERGDAVGGDDDEPLVA